MAAGQSLDPFDECPILKVLFSEGDQLPTLSGVLKDVDITGFTVRLTLERPNDVLIKSATFPDPTNGVFTFVWETTDLIEGFGQLATLQIINTLGEPSTNAKFRLNIHRKAV